jgi:hypothetical protein
MFRRQHHERRAPQCVRSGGEYLDRVFLLRLKDHMRAFTLADPVRLQRLHALRPIDAAEVQQFIGILRNAEVPLIQILLDHGRAAAFAVTIFAPHLLARQRRIAIRAPIDG